MPTSVDSKPLTYTLNPLDATLMKNRGKGAQNWRQQARPLFECPSIEEKKITACPETGHATCNRLCIPRNSLILGTVPPHTIWGAMVQRLARSPFKAKIRVRFPLALPNFLTEQNWRHNGILVEQSSADLCCAHGFVVDQPRQQNVRGH